MRNRKPPISISVAVATLIACIAQAATITIPAGANLQAAINASAPGDVLIFPAANVGSSLSFPGARTYQGGPLTWVGGKAVLGTINGPGATFAKFTAVKAGLTASRGTSKLTVTDCTFADIPNTSPDTLNSGIFFDAISDSSITHNSFRNIRGAAAIFGYNPLRCDISDNVFDGNWKGMHILWGTVSPTPCFSTILRNVFNGTEKYPAELQGCVDTLEFAFNWSDNQTPPDKATMPYSLPLSDSGSNATQVYSKRVRVHHNYAGGTGLVPLATIPWRANGQSGFNQSWGLEIGGADTEVDHNIFNGPFAVAICDTCTTPAWSYHDNVFAGVKPLFGGLVIPEFKGVAPLPVNVYGNQILPNMLAAPKPEEVTSGRQWAVDSGAGGLPPPVVSPAPSTIKATVNADGSVTVTWTGPGPLTARGSDPKDAATFKDAVSPATLKAFPPGWTVWISDGSGEAMVTIPGTPTGIAFAPVLVAPATQPATQPATMPVDIHLHSDDGGMTWRVQ